MASTCDLNLVAPLSGLIVPLEQVPDPVFSQKLMGDGIAIDPSSQELVSPVQGTVTLIHPSLHAVSIETAEGIQVLLHVGIDTVKLKGKGFKTKVKVGDKVQPGQTLLTFDADLIAKSATSLITVLIVTESKETTFSWSEAGFISAKSLIGSSASLATTAPAAQKQESGIEVSSPAVRIELKTGIHARPAALIAAYAKKFKSQVQIKKGEKSANAKSVVSLMTLEVLHHDEVTVVALGPDSKAASQELAMFLKEMREEEQKDGHSSTAAAKKTPVIAKPQRAGILSGVGASPGLAIGTVHQVRVESFNFAENAAAPHAERTKLTNALSQASTDLQKLFSELQSKTDAAQAAIFSAHIELLEDPDLIETAAAYIEAGKTAEFAWNSATSSMAERLSNLNNELMANRANDLRDVGSRVLRVLVGQPSANMRPSGKHVILIAENLTPSDTAQIDRESVLGFCTVSGGATSHVAILARSLGLPALAGIDPQALKIENGTEVVLDADSGELRLNPTAEEKARIKVAQEERAESRKRALQLANEQAYTTDGHHVEVAANIGSAEDAREAVQMGCDGVGLLRSEFLFLGRSTAPTEDEQHQVLQEIADILGDRPLTIRTLDVGGDKPLQYLPIPAEENPFLGVRGLRVGLLQDPEMFREQLRAILRVRTKGKLNVMFPMVATIEEFRAAKRMLEEERAKLGVAPVQVGIMVEVPSAALLADVFAPEVDFFSVGTNDLAQYTLAMDRGHKELAKQVDGVHPSILKLIEMTVTAAHRHGKWVGVCGGIAGDAKAVPILVGLGVDELSVSLPVIPIVKSQVRESSLSDSQKLARQALHVEGAKQVRGLTLAQDRDSNRTQAQL